MEEHPIAVTLVRPKPFHFLARGRVSNPCPPPRAYARIAPAPLHSRGSRD